MSDTDPILQPPADGAHETERIPGAHADRSAHKFGRTVAAISLVAGGAFGAGLVLGEVHSRHAGTHETQEDVQDEPQKDINPALSTRENLDIVAAVEADTCKTKVTAKEVESIYARLFTDEYKPKELSDMQSEADSVTKKLESLTSTMRFADLTEAERTFIDDSFKNKLEGDIKEYTQVFRGYLGRFGITLTDNWPKGTQDAKLLRDAGVTEGVHQMTPKEFANNYSAKAQIVEAMDSMSKIPLSVISASGVKSIVLGKFKNNHYDGYAYYSEKVIAMNVSQPKGTTFSSALGMHMPDLIDHEISHLLDNEVCAQVLGQYMDDPGYESLNRAFSYGKHKEKVLNTNRVTPNGFTTLGSDLADSEAVVATAYGANDVAEDKATLLGQTVLNTQSLERLYMDTKTDNTVINEKVAMLLARLTAKDPKIGEYYTSMVRLAELARVVSDAELPYQIKLGEMAPGKDQDDPQNPFNPPEVVKTKEYKALIKKLAPYNRLSENIYTHLYSLGKKPDTSRDAKFGMR